MGIYHPYEDIEWSTIDQRPAQLHLHEPRTTVNPKSVEHDPATEAAFDPTTKSSPGDVVEKYATAGYGALAVTEHEYYIDQTKRKGEPYSSEFDVTSWPWSDWDVDAEALDLIAIQGAELRGSIEGISKLHDIVSLNNDLGHGQEKSLAWVAREIDSRGGVSFLPHTGKYVTPETIDIYTELFTAVDSLLGVEIYNARDRYPSCRPIWDALLTHFGSARPIWAFGNDDYHAKYRGSGEERFNQSRNVLLVTERSTAAAVSALRNGQTYIQYTGEGSGPVPTLDDVSITEKTITIDISHTNTVTWVGSDGPVQNGPVIDTVAVDSPYVRAELYGEDGAIAYTQPFYLTS